MAPKPKNHNSCYWKNIYLTSKYLNDVCFWVVGNGKKINVWANKWIDNFKIEH